MVPRLNGEAGTESAPPVRVMLLVVTFCAAAVPLLMMGKAESNRFGLVMSTPAGPIASDAGDASHSTLMVTKLPGEEVRRTVSWFVSASVTDFTILSTLGLNSFAPAIWTPLREMVALETRLLPLALPFTITIWQWDVPQCWKVSV